MVSLFIERVLEVFLTSWRAQQSAQLEERAEHRGQTRRIGRAASAGVGVYEFLSECGEEGEGGG